MKKYFLCSLIMFLFLFSSACSYKTNTTESNVTSTSKIDRPEDKKEDSDKVKQGDFNNSNDNNDHVNKNKTKYPQEDESVIDYVVYDGPIEHIFFHPLVVYPSLAFDGDNMSQGYDEYFVTVKEFKAMIESLYTKNYMLIKMSDLFETKTINGKKQVTKKDLKLPKDKKPLIISVDDINYYPYMLANGNVNKLIINSEGNISTISKDLNGKEVISEENEIVPLLNHFVEEHPDFSLNGAKGILALTGYEGVLGYRTNAKESLHYENEKNEAIRVINKLKETGWEFASHGYGHLATANISLNTLKADTNRWLTEVSPLIGDTNIYIYPFGSSVLPDNPKFKYLQSMGFQIMCSVGPNAYLKYTADYAMMDRVHIDGIGLETQQHILNRFFDSVAILDQARFMYH